MKIMSKVWLEEQLGRRPQLFASFVQSHNDKIQYFVRTARLAAGRVIRRCAHKCEPSLLWASRR